MRHQTRMDGRSRALAASREGAPGDALHRFAGAAALLVLLLVAYLPTLRAAYIWDDPRYVTENPQLRDLAGLRHIWTQPGATIQYYPLVFTTFWLEYHLWGLRPVGYHFDNLLLHVVNATLLWLILRRLRVPGAWLIACVFGLHPVQVETVAWVTERKNILSGLFYFAALLVYLPITRIDPAPAQGTRRWTLYGLALALFSAALLSKTVTASLPAVILLVIWWQRGRLSVRDVLLTLPFFVLGVAAGVLTAWLEKHNVRAIGEAWNLSGVERLLIAGRAVWFYLGKLLWPVGLNFNYAKWDVVPAQGWNWIYPLAAVVLLAALWALRRRIGRGPLTAALFFGGTLLPALGFVNVFPMRYSFAADHFQYLACIGPLAALIAGAAWALRARATGQPGSLLAGRVSAVLLVVALLVLTPRYARVFENEETLWSDVLTKNPSSFLAHNNLGTIYFARSQFDLASQHFGAAARLEPGYYEALYNCGRAAQAGGKLDTALEYYQQTERVRPDKPDGHYGIGLVYAKLGRTDEARAEFHQALECDPNYEAAHIDLANVLAAQGRRAEAIDEYQAALRTCPDSAAAHADLANVLAQDGRLAEALPHFDRSLQLDPTNSNLYRNRSHALATVGRLDEAIAGYRTAIRLAANDSAVHCDLAATLRQRGDLDGAIQEYQEALRLAPRDERAQRGLSAAMRQRDGR